MSSDEAVSKFISFVLRHDPQSVGLVADGAGWVAVRDLIFACQSRGYEVTFERLQQIVSNSDKQRFSFNEDWSKIRANQGHSFEVELGYTAAEPPAILYHGTASRFVESIRKSGLDRRQRHHVHLSARKEVALEVGKRHGKPIVLEIDAAAMHGAGAEFFVSDNGVWLVDSVPAIYIRFPA